MRIYLQVFSSLGLKYEVETKEHDFLQFFKFFFFFILMTFGHLNLLNIVFGLNDKVILS